MRGRSSSPPAIHRDRGACMATSEQVVKAEASRREPGMTPYIAPETRLREFTPRALILGTLLGMIFGASSLYLVLKVGLTVSASIPVGVTMPAIMILGFDLGVTRVMLVAILGSLLGILMMIPLRRALIVAQHGLLKYPEGTACAEVLKAGASAESQDAASESAKREMEALGGATTSAKTIFTGLGIGLIYKTLMDPQGFRLWKSTPERIFGPPFDAGSISAEISPELLGVGYIIGPRIASIMCAGGVLAYLVLIPA